MMVLMTHLGTCSQCEEDVKSTGPWLFDHHALGKCGPRSSNVPFHLCVDLPVRGRSLRKPDQGRISDGFKAWRCQQPIVKRWPPGVQGTRDRPCTFAARKNASGDAFPRVAPCMRRIRILAQPDDSTCGPTALHAVYDAFGLELPLEQIIDEVHFLEDGGTLAVFLGIHALKQGFHARIHSYNLRVFDPTWDGLPPEELRRKLLAQTRHKEGKKLHATCLAYSKFLKEGGEVRFDDPSPTLLQSYFDRDLPVLTGLSATYLYKSKREYSGSMGESIYDDLRGKPMGHFVVLCGMDPASRAGGRTVLVADPYQDNPYSSDLYYHVPVGRLINAIMLGIVTYDANLLIISKDPL
jgi:hypothetical protein